MKELVAHYDILKILGHGGYSAVFKARSKFDADKVVALKQLDVTVEDENSKAYKDFKDEVRTLQKLDHPNIVKVFDEHILDNKPSFEMEYIDGETLETLIKRRYIFSIDDFKSIFEQIGSALSYCHQFEINEHSTVKGIIHNDINPKNIVKTKDSEGNDKYMLIDFGLSFSDNGGVRQSKIEEGMAEYKAPEKWDGYTVLPASDVYSFGVVLYELLTCQPPFPIKDYKNAHEMMLLEQKHKLHPIPNICELRKNLVQSSECDIPEWILYLINKCLQKKPEKRFKNGKELFDFFQKANSGNWIPEQTDLDEVSEIHIVPSSEAEELIDAYILTVPNIFCEQQQFYIHKPVSKIGRTVVNAYWQVADIAINTTDNFISKNHCQILREKNESGKFEYFLQDIQPSKNGTYYNKDKNTIRLTMDEKVLLKNGDYFWIGNTKIYFYNV